MTAFLYRLGKLSHGHPWRVLAAWFLIVLAVAGAGFGFGGKLSDGFTIPGTQSQNALDRLDAVFPQAAGASAQAVMVAPAGTRVDEGAARTTVNDTIEAIERIDGIETVSSPFSEYAVDAVSADHRAAIVSIQFSGTEASVKTSTLDALQRTASIGKDAGWKVAFTGQVFQQTAFGPSITEVFGLAFAAVVLIVTFGSLLAAGMPLISAIIGVLLSVAGLMFTANFTDVASASLTLALMLGLAVGIDYGLFVISKYRDQLALDVPIAEALPKAVATAGTAVVFAGVTVIIALVGLLIVGIPFLSVMGVGAAFAVFLGVCGSTTLLPAVLALAGRRLVPKPGSRLRARATAAAEGRTHTLGSRWGALIEKAPALFLVLVVAALGVLAIPAASMRLALPTNGTEAPGTGPRVAYDLTTASFGEGRNGPLVLLIDVTQNNDFITDLDRMKDRIAALPDVKAVGKPTPNETLDTAIMQVIPDSGPTSDSTIALVHRIRDLSPTFEREYRMPVSVTGSTAVQIDISDRLGSALVPFVLVVVGLSVILLMAVFRSLVVPLKAAVGFLLSLSASVGATVAVFQWGWGADLLHVEPGPLLSFLPILGVAILFGLSMDYEVFIVSGMRETWAHTGDARLAVRKGFAGGVRVVTAAALIMIFVFASFIPEGSGTIKPIAFTLAVGILLDAFLIRMTLVPAVMFLFRRSAWYLPRWLDRLLPTVDIEGEGIVRHEEDVAWAQGEARWALSSTDLVPPPPFETRPLTVHAERGTTSAIAVPAAARRGVVATLTGHLEPASGRVQVAGAVAPTGARELRQVAAPVIDDGSAADATPSALVAERLRFAPRRRRSGSLRTWLQVLPEPVVRERPIGELPPEERLAVLALAAAAGGAVAIVVDAGDLGPDALDRLAALLDLVAAPSSAAGHGGDRAAVIVTSPIDRAATRLGAAPTRREVSA
ncbi:MMPL family transporter [Amnibacterium kyonggiense]|uniref:RND superfamily putative drug exporter n=1 Tax=Amnibacterium kyonggiense TaxID=595671 RepID=A0A4R7FJC5_9MICO|nr:MMPL family transporter [Amnibacterium kyonggiense]TDS76172.1 RND superfamily putative drug exporter [Amnibacterium kyonggiense]